MMLYMDGFGHYATAQATEKWDTFVSVNDAVTIDASGRTLNCVKKVSTDNGSNGYLQTGPFITQTGAWTQTASGVCGFAYKVLDLSRTSTLNGTSTALRGLLTVYDGQYPVMAFYLNASGTISVLGNLYGSGSTLLGNSITAVQSDTWVYLEFKWLIAASGTITIRANGTTVFSFSGDTRGVNAGGWTFTTKWNSVLVFGMGANTNSSHTQRMCDFYLCDLTGTYNNDFLGDVTINYIVPNAVGNAAVWTPSAGNNWDDQEEVPPDSDTTYVSTTTVGNRDSYNYQAVTADPLAIQICMFARAEVIGGVQITPGSRIAGVDYDYQEFGIGDVAYTYYLQPLDTSPASTVQWTKAEIDATEFSILKTG